VPYAIAGGVLALSFGVLARQTGFSALGAMVMSAVVFAGSAQFAAISIIAAGGGLGAAIGAAALMNGRFLPMGIALAPSLPGSALRRDRPRSDGRRRVLGGSCCSRSAAPASMPVATDWRGSPGTNTPPVARRSRSHCPTICPADDAGLHLRLFHSFL